ncbi:MAG: winged helix-turn-helix transcriptional regulator [Cyclobacteriaceae bacterium]
MRIKNKEVLVELAGKRYHCAMDIAMSFVGGKWKTVVLWYLRKEKKRFGELRDLCPQITERMLSITLKQLEKDGLVSRKVYTKKPPLKVEYSLTDFGKSLIPMLEEIAKWGRQVAKTKGKIIES